MNNWPQGWTDEGGYGRGSASPRPENARVMPHVPPQQSGGHDYGYDGGYNQGRTYRGGGQHPGPPPDRYDDYPEPRGRGLRLKTVVWTLVLVLLVTGVGTYFWADSKLRREVDLASLEDRPAAGKGTNYLIVGTDSREGLSEEERREMRTGHASGARADTMMLLHVGSEGNTLVSLPRDSWVTIPEFTGSESGNRIPAQQNKLNAAYAIQGPELLARTVEYNTGLRIDHYAEIGFGGFASVVDALGGVEMCFDKPIKDKNSGADFAEGCQDLNGAESLAFVRQRYQEAMGDLGRTKNQQKFLGALGDQVAKPSTLLNPFKLYPTMSASLDSLVVDHDMSVWQLGRMFLALRGVSGEGGTQMNIPVANPGLQTDKGSAVQWDMERTEQLMNQLRNDEKVTVSDD
ncbi:LCP family protein [Streptomyces sodiiphilus]|uniref:LCP family protein n=1 Tax=Streptomyces sodiiphilus TaxID=226217 RepID=A0ABN2PK00_9ACTN